MREYRKGHPEYVKRNRRLQADRRKGNADRHPLLPDRSGDVVKMDVSSRKLPVISGTYKLIPMDVVKMDVITVQLSVLEDVT
jgi:hypothetical protein